MWDGYLVLPAHVIEDWQRLQGLGDAAGLGRGSGVVMLIQGQDLEAIRGGRDVKTETSPQDLITHG